MRLFIIISIISIMVSCEHRNVKYSGMNDLVIGVHQIVLFENGDFYLELGAGGQEGKYEIKNDTIHLDYFDGPKNWPDKILMTNEYFETIRNDGHQRTIKIKRRTRVIE